MEKFAALYNEHYDKVFKLSLSHLRNSDQAKDVTQEAFLRAFERLETLRDESCFLAWVNVIAMNIIRNWSVRERNRCLPFSEMLESELRQSAKQEDVFSKALDIMELRKAIMSIPYAAQQIILLRYYYDFTEKEIAAIMTLPLGTVKSKLYRARLMLAAAIEKGILPKKENGRNLLALTVSNSREIPENRRDGRVL